MKLMTQCNEKGFELEVCCLEILYFYVMFSTWNLNIFASVISRANEVKIFPLAAYSTNLLRILCLNAD